METLTTPATQANRHRKTPCLFTVQELALIRRLAIREQQLRHDAGLAYSATASRVIAETEAALLYLNINFTDTESETPQ